MLLHSTLLSPKTQNVFSHQLPFPLNNGFSLRRLKGSIMDGSCHHLFFFLGYGRCRTVARSLHEHKQSKRHLYKDPEGPKVQANHNKPKTTQDTKTTRKSPSQICVSSKTKTANQTHKGARAQTKTPTKRICQGTQRTYHCVTLKNMPKLIIHHDIL